MVACGLGHGIESPPKQSLTEKILITATGAGAKLSADDSVNVPEPASLALLGVGILGLGFVAGRKRSV